MSIFSSLIEKQDADKLSRYIEQLAENLVNPANLKNAFIALVRLMEVF